MRNRKPAKTQATHSGANQLRIIGGQWRGRKLNFPAIEGLRPTPNRVRETLFNWLTPVLPGAMCLDLFAGSGALGWEALSRGAASVTWVDSSAAVTDQLRSNLKLLQAGGAVHTMAATDFLQLPTSTGFDIVFLDPPFGQDLVKPCIELLDRGQALNANAWVYIETPREEAAPLLPVHWSLHRDKQAGQVSYRLYRVSSAS